jgi:hypothetical protein
MHFGIKSLLAAAVLGLTGLAVPAGAQDAQLVSYEELLDRVARLEQEVAEAPSVPMAPPAAAETSTDDGGFYGVYENVFVTPYFSQNTSMVIGGGTANVAVRQFNWDLEYSSRFEFGNVDACSHTGWRVRYWHFDHSENDRSVQAGGNQIQISPDALSGFGIQTVNNGEIASATHSLRMSVLDMEMLKRELSTDGGFTASVGLRYARIDQWNRGRILAANGALIVNNSLNHNFEGIGPTLFGEYLKRFECSYWGAFINARGSLLYGESNYRYDERNANGAINQTGRNINDQDLLANAEMQIGADYRRPTGSCHEFFLRIALEAQYWHNAGSASADTNGSANANAQDADLGFLGFTIATGLDW